MSFVNGLGTILIHGTNFADAMPERYMRMPRFSISCAHLDHVVLITLFTG